VPPRREDFDSAVAAHWDEVYRLAYRLTGDRHDAEDAAQETFYLAYRGWERFEGRAAVRTWLFRIAIRVCGQLLERRQDRKRTDAPPLEAATPGPVAAAAAGERNERIHEYGPYWCQDALAWSFCPGICSFLAALNCACSVEPSRAAVDASPPEIVWSTLSK